MRKKYNLKVALRTIAAYLFTIFIFYLLFSRIDLVGTLKAFMAISPGSFFLAALICVLINVFAASDLKRKILSLFDCDISFKEALFIKMGGMPPKLIPGYKIFDLMQAAYLKAYHATPITVGIILNIVSQIMSLISVSLLFLLGFVSYWLFLRPSTDISYPGLVNVSAFLVVLFLGLVSFLIFIPDAAKAIVRRIPFFPRFAKKRQFALLLAYSVILQSSELIIFVILARSLTLNIPLILVLLYIPLSILIANLPITIAGIGVRETATIAFFLNYGSKETLLALGILVSLIEYLLPILIGLFFFIPLVRKLRRLPEFSANNG